MFLTKPYEISVWDDIWSSTEHKFVEQRITVIGTNDMVSQNKVIEPILTRNINGVKKLSFKMYKKYIDSETGEEITNPFMRYLINERKVKLYYENKWYDFIIKRVVETSSNYLYQFELEDALVQELSKNGFGVTFDPSMNNNYGTAKKLAEDTLKDTDWTVESEVIVQKVEEHLVYVSYSGEKLVATQLIDQQNLWLGVEEKTLQEIDTQDKIFLAFYSSCTTKPHRFQFIVLDNNKEIFLDEKQIILNENCQYFIEYEEHQYTVEDEDYSFYLPSGWQVMGQEYFPDVVKDDTTISYKYRGARYGYAQQSTYLPKLNKYVNIYEHDLIKEENGETNTITKQYYGYSDTEYNSPTLLTNYISNTEFKNTSGWKGVYYSFEDCETPEVDDTRAVVETAFGRFDNQNVFVSVIDSLNAGEGVPEGSSAYIKLSFPICKNDNTGYSSVLNSGIKDNATVIGNLQVGDRLVLKAKDQNETWPTGLDFELVECEYLTEDFSYRDIEATRITFLEEEVPEGALYKIFKVDSSTFTENIFKKTNKIYLKISNTSSNKTEYYLKDIQLYKYVAIDENGTPMSLETQADNIEDGITTTTYYYFSKDEYDATPCEVEALSFDHVSNSLEYSSYRPLYNIGAEKIRTISAKESNYFNILQSIAETFECWLELEVRRNNETGQIQSKIAKFKNYAGSNNYAAFRYGVNLKDIERTFASKDIVTKLIVKNNSNELANSGFCTIQRAQSNMTGENYIYDFQYYHKVNLLNADTFVNTLYYGLGAEGPDIPGTSDINLNGYYPRLKALNRQMLNLTDEINGFSAELLELKAEKEVVDAAISAATSGIEEIRENFTVLTNHSIEGYAIQDYGTTEGIKITNDKNSIEENPPENDYIVHLGADGFEIETYEKENGLCRFTVKRPGEVQTLSSAYVNATCYIKVQLVKQTTWCYLPFYVTIYFAKGEAISEEVEIKIEAVDTSDSNISAEISKYQEYLIALNSNTTRQQELNILINGYVDEGGVEHPGKQNKLDELNNQLVNIRDNLKAPLNKEFFSKYNRFIQEGTWIDEQYVDDEKYYADAQSVLYNSCYPKVEYTINVLSLSGLPGYELFTFDIGEKTYVEDEEFFGKDKFGYPNKEEIIISEMVEHLDSPETNAIKVQNFKNQFQDLFQKITATVQQTQYNEGSYKKAVELVEASDKKKNEFLMNSLSDPNSVLANAGQNEVIWDNSGITITNKNNRSEQLRLVSSGILFQQTGDSGEKWVTGLTPQGISASLIQAGRINTGKIQIMNGSDATFMWDSHGLSAYDFEEGFNGSVAKIIPNKFVRFDKFGLYGINGHSHSWKPFSIENVANEATFALTWEGLKVTGNDGVVAKIGKQDNKIIDITKDGKNVFSITNNGATSITGTVTITKGDSSGSESTLGDTMVDSYFQYAYTEKEGDTIAENKWTRNSKPDGYNSIIHYLWSRTVTEKASGEIIYSSQALQLPPIQTFKVELSNENIWLPTDSNGDLVGDNWEKENAALAELTKMSAALYQGGTKITDGVSYSWSISGENQVLTLSSDKGSEVYLQLKDDDQTSTSIPDTVEVGVVVSYSIDGSKLDFPKAYFTITKAKGGAPGEYATVYEIRPERAAINISEWKYNDDRFVVEVYKFTDTMEPVDMSKEDCPVRLVVAGGDSSIDGNGNISIKIDPDATSLDLTLQAIGDKPTILDQEKVSLVKNGEKGDTGDAGAIIACYVESTAGQLFQKDVDTTTTLTARIFENGIEISTEEDYLYKWYIDAEEWTGKTGKVLNDIQVDEITNKEVYFVATPR